MQCASHSVHMLWHNCCVLFYKSSLLFYKSSLLFYKSSLLFYNSSLLFYKSRQLVYKSRQLVYKSSLLFYKSMLLFYKSRQLVYKSKTDSKRIPLICFAFPVWSERGLRAECVPNPFHYYPTNPLPPPCLPPLLSPLSGCPPFADFPGVCTAGSSPGCFRSLLFAEHGAAISRGTSKRG